MVINAPQITQTPYTTKRNTTAAHVSQGDIQTALLYISRSREEKQIKTSYLFKILIRHRHIDDTTSCHSDVTVTSSSVWRWFLGTHSARADTHDPTWKKNLNVNHDCLSLLGGVSMCFCLRRLFISKQSSGHSLFLRPAPELRLFFSFFRVYVLLSLLPNHGVHRWRFNSSITRQSVCTHAHCFCHQSHRIVFTDSKSLRLIHPPTHG